MNGIRIQHARKIALITFGVETVLKEKFQIDLAGQSSESGEVGILSMVFRF